MWRRLYDAVVRAAAHRHAQPWLAALAFSESSFFPIPPDVMLAPMVLARRNRAWRYALIATAGSTIGGLFGYLIGALFIEQILPWLYDLGYGQGYETVRQWFAEYGFWAVLFAGFSPVPYKLFTIAAGALGMAVVPFALASAVGRGARFFIVAGLVRWLGPTFETRVLKYLDWIGWIIVGLVVIAYLVYRFAV
ncbi:YqaA family protein [Salinisphaera sp. SPP-AMP-43]|uniref:YqaA family protein n=1 Tax=Salinisphaera sp. SPP-AMP-43 TaxID=3121288 RepID=UPI003C6E5145